MRSLYKFIHPCHRAGHWARLPLVQSNMPTEPEATTLLHWTTRARPRVLPEAALRNGTQVQADFCSCSAQVTGERNKRRLCIRCVSRWTQGGKGPHLRCTLRSMQQIQHIVLGTIRRSCRCFPLCPALPLAWRLLSECLSGLGRGDSLSRLRASETSLQVVGEQARPRVG